MREDSLLTDISTSIIALVPIVALIHTFALIPISTSNPKTINFKIDPKIDIKFVPTTMAKSFYGNIQLSRRLLLTVISTPVTHEKGR